MQSLRWKNVRRFRDTIHRRMLQASEQERMMENSIDDPVVFSAHSKKVSFFHARKTPESTVLYNVDTACRTYRQPCEPYLSTDSADSTYRTHVHTPWCANHSRAYCCYCTYLSSIISHWYRNASQLSTTLSRQMSFCASRESILLSIIVKFNLHPKAPML